MNMETLKWTVEFIGWVVVIVLLWTLLIYILPDRAWSESENSIGTVCTMNKNWLEMPDLKKMHCIKYDVNFRTK